MNEHLSKQFESELDGIRDRLTRMGGLVEEQLRAAIDLLGSGDRDAIETVIARDAGVDELEVALDDACIHVIARRQPTAIDLRLVMAVGKMVTDLERIGDEAKKIAKTARKMLDRGLVGTSAVPELATIRRMGESTLGMLHAVLTAFVRLDVAAAVEIVRSDKQVDEQFRGILRQLVTYMMEDPRTITSSLDIVFIAKSVERIGDHCKNLAEDVVYVARGRDVRHAGAEALEREAQNR